MVDKVHYSQTDEQSGQTFLEVENRWGRFYGFSCCDVEDEYSRFAGYISCEMQIERKTLKAKAKAMYQRYLGIYNAYKTLTQNYSEDEPIMQAMWRQVKDAQRRYINIKKQVGNYSPENITKVMDLRLDQLADFRSKVEKMEG